jgi:serine/threonine-protein kinase
LQVRIVHSTVPPPSQVSGQAVPQALEALVLCCLAKKPDERPGSIAEVLVTLEQLALSHPWSQMQAESWWQAYRRESGTNAQETV